MTAKEQRAYSGARVEIERCRRGGDTGLSLQHSGLTRLPPEIGTLTGLHELYLNGNQLSTLPSEIGMLSSLDTLDISGNILSTLPPALERLVGLKRLYLMGNPLIALPRWLYHLKNLKELCLHGNPLLALSPEVLGPDPGKSVLEVPHPPKPILDYYFARLAAKALPLNEVKIIFVGRGAAGKTSIARALLRKRFNEAEQTTSGISRSDWKMKGCKDGPVTAHIWDFAGQVITHSLHQFFFSIRSVYVLVLTGRENSELADAEYWLRLIRAFGTDENDEGPPVVVALNKADTPGCEPKLDQGALEERYPFIRGFAETDCKTGRGIAALNDMLCQAVNDLKWVRDPFPELWDRVRRALAEGGKKRPHLSYREYRDLCMGKGIDTESEQDSLAEILHNLGAALNYRNDLRLREATVLQPGWLTTSVYALVRYAQAKSGVLTQAGIDDALKEERDPSMRRFLIQLMERFEVAYPARDSEDGLWLVPQALRNVQPAEARTFRDIVDATRLRYTYSALPEGLVARAIVRLHGFIEETDGKKEQWASGAILTRDGARALLRMEPDRLVTVTVTGPPKARQQLAGLCRDEMRAIHIGIPGLDPEEETLVQGEWIRTAELENDERKGEATRVFVKGQGKVTVNPEEENNAYSEKSARRSEIWKPSVFISYSKEDFRHRNRIELELKILRNAGLVAGAWVDSMLIAGSDWHRRIQQELADADVVIVLVSAAALTTDYIMQYEIPGALAAGKVVVPVMLEKRDLPPSLAVLTSLPPKQKPLNHFNPRADGWHAVYRGLEAVLTEIIERRREGK